MFSGLRTAALATATLSRPPSRVVPANSAARDLLTSLSGLKFHYFLLDKAQVQPGIEPSFVNCEQLDFQIQDATALKFVAVHGNKPPTRCRWWYKVEKKRNNCFLYSTSLKTRLVHKCASSFIFRSGGDCKVVP